MNDTALDSAIAIKLFIGSAAELPLSIEPELRYEWIADTLKRTKYHGHRAKNNSMSL